MVHAKKIIIVIALLLLVWSGCERKPTDEAAAINTHKQARNHESETDSLQVPDWVVKARIAGLDLDHEMDDSELDALLRERKLQNVSVLELDSRLSNRLSDAEFTKEVAFLDRAARRAHQVGMKSVIYYPALEVLTPDGGKLPNSMFKDRPDWIQYSLSGEPNVFYGSLEHWVPPDWESAWMSPNSPYREFFIARVRQLANTALDGIWLDVPTYSDTGAPWAGAGTHAAKAFRAWSASRGHNKGRGYPIPRKVDQEDPAFRAWIRWRHENLAVFLEEIRQAAQEVNPDFMVIVEVYPVDNVDATATGLDGAFRINGKNFIRVWEIDSVSNTRAMKFSNYEDFNSKITMFKYAKAIERTNPAWVFSYGFESLDAGLTMAAAVATGAAPFEAQTPSMTTSADPEVRTRWYGFIKEHGDALLGTQRYAQAGVWYSSATRDYVDLPEGGQWGMYITHRRTPSDDDDWWSDEIDDSALSKPHLGGYRGAAHLLTQLGIPFKVVTDPGNPDQYLKSLELLWLPSVAAMSGNSASAIRKFVRNGGVILATGKMPAMRDELGDLREFSALDDVFGFDRKSKSSRQTQKFGRGYAIYRPDLEGRFTYKLAGTDKKRIAATISALEQLLRAHVSEVLRFDVTPGVHIEISRPSPDRHYLYIVNYTGLKQPLVRNTVPIDVRYRPPEGLRATRAEVFTPDIAGSSGSTPVTEAQPGLFALNIQVDQFALVAIDLTPVANPKTRP